MSKSKAPSLPSTPEYIQGPEVSIGQGLVSGSIYGSNPMLAETVNTSPDITRLTLEGLQAQLAPQLRDSRQDIINQLEANNQLTGSTTASALGNIQTDYESQLVNAGAQAGIADINRALQNRVNLFGTGLNVLQSNTTNQNQFNLENYQNQVAKVLGEQKQQSGGWLGGLTGAAGGAMAGSMFGPVGIGVGALAGGLAGSLGPQGSGGALFQSGAGLAGSRLGGTFASGTGQAPVYSAGALSPESISGGLTGSFGQPGNSWRNYF